MNKSIHVLLVLRLICLTIFIYSVAVMIGWIFNIPYLTNITTAYIPMKFITALSFLIASVCLFIMSFPKKGHENILRLTLIIAGSLMIFLFMATLFLSNILNISTGIENLFVQENAAETLLNAPGRPSLYTMLCFALFSFACLNYLTTSLNKRFIMRIIAVTIILISLVSIIGYTLNVPVFYNVWPGISIAIALNTALLFGLLGLGMFIVGLTI